MMMATIGIVDYCITVRIQALDIHYVMRAYSNHPGSRMCARETKPIASEIEVSYWPTKYPHRNAAPAESPARTSGRVRYDRAVVIV